MNTTRFICNFSQIVKTMKIQSFPESDLYQLAMQSALKLEELELQDRQISITEEKTRQELELAIISAKAQNKQLIAEALKAVIQAESMVRSVQDNAAINRANTYVGFLNVVGNASDTNGIKSHSNNVIETINLIDVSPMGDYSATLENLRQDLLDLLHKGDGSKEVFIYTPKLEIQENERIKIMGFSSFGNNDSRFFVNDEQVESTRRKTLIFSAPKEGFYTIRFESYNDTNDKWVSDEIQIEVRKL